MILREYQVNASDCIIAAWEIDPSTLLCLPTGTGKTVVFADIIRRRQPARTLVVAHREELIWQARDTIEKTTGLSCEIEMGHLAASGGDLFSRSNVIVSTVQTQTSGQEGKERFRKFDPMQFGTLIIDECHRAPADSYRKTIDWYCQNPNLRVLGVTATPDRSDEAALGQVFKSVAFDYEIEDAINDGWLVPIEQQMVNIESLDYSQIRTTAGELNGADLAAVVEDEHNLLGVASASLEIIGTKRTLVFAATVKQAERLCEIFNRHRPGTFEWICGETDKDERRAILQRFKQGGIQGVVNCACLTEGYDNAWVEVVVMAKPTKSRSHYCQMVGRATRPLPGVVDSMSGRGERKGAIALSAKPACLVVDFCGNAGKHLLMTTADILGGNFSNEAVAIATAQAKKAGKAVRMGELLENAEAEIKRIEAEKKAKEEQRLAEAARKANLKLPAKFTSTKVSPFDLFGITPIVNERGWHTGKKLSDRQRNVLLKGGMNPDQFTYAQGCQLVQAQVKRWGENKCTFKQARFLRKNGYSPNLSYKEARKIIDAWAKNGWRRPQPQEQAA